MQRGRRNGRKERNGNDYQYDWRRNITKSDSSERTKHVPLMLLLGGRRAVSLCNVDARFVGCTATGLALRVRLSERSPALCFLLFLKKAVARDSQDTLTLHICDVDTHPRRARAARVRVPRTCPRPPRCGLLT